MENYVRKEVDNVGVVRYYNSKGQYHRIDGPTIIWPDGSKAWHINGKCHRLNGPAIEYVNYEEWCINNIFYLKLEHNRLVLFSMLEPQRINLNPTEE
jgi:hypothetical protein